jgi:hypothetical protein
LIEQAFVGTEVRSTKTKNSGLIPLAPEFKKIYLKMEKGFPEDFVFKKKRGKGNPSRNHIFGRCGITPGERQELKR